MKFTARVGEGRRVTKSETRKAGRDGVISTETPLTKLTYLEVKMAAKKLPPTQYCLKLSVAQI